MGEKVLEIYKSIVMEFLELHLLKLKRLKQTSILC